MNQTVGTGLGYAMGRLRCPRPTDMIDSQAHLRRMCVQRNLLVAMEILNQTRNEEDHETYWPCAACRCSSRGM
ncbi:hypothetical protein BVI2075_230005 [Burkholderia vietnamiensis]|nr:hypothetical protein BVI2075_230005 [Burkholderia vietnamiensis]CAG9229549.1 hypothetical protein BVI1335_70229 [Burkholderia vietnamiensis]